MNPQNPNHPQSNPYGTPQQPGLPQYPAEPPSNPYGMPQYPSTPQYPGMPQQTGGFPPGYQPPAPNNGMAVASMVVSLVAIPLMCVWIGFLLGLLGVIFGHVAKRQIRDTGAGGHGMATAGLAIGYVVVGLLLLAIGALVILGLSVPLSTTTAE